MTAKTDPTFYDMSKAFFATCKIGSDEICPRDGGRGCAFVDTLPRHHRGRCTHYLSWTWAYSLSTVRSALQFWVDTSGQNPSTVVLFMCFFVNNQYRILAPLSPRGQPQNGSDHLDELFERNVQRVGQVIALLDTYESSIYFTRLWTIFEQFICIKNNVPVRMILPPVAHEALLKEFERGKAGLLRVKESLCIVDSQNAKASVQADEVKIKEIIQTHLGGFKAVNELVVNSMVAWVASSVQLYMKELVTQNPIRNGQHGIMKLCTFACCGTAPRQHNWKRILACGKPLASATRPDVYGSRADELFNTREPVQDARPGPFGNRPQDETI